MTHAILRQQLSQCNRRSVSAIAMPTRCQETLRVWGCFGIGCLCSGGVLFDAVARNIGSRGRALSLWLSVGYLHPTCSIPFPTLASPPPIYDKNRMR
jgi:hypothetical protein